MIVISTDESPVPVHFEPSEHKALWYSFHKTKMDSVLKKLDYLKFDLKNYDKLSIDSHL